MGMRQQTKVSSLLERRFERMLPPHHRALAHIEQIVRLHDLVSIHTGLTTWRQIDRGLSGANWIVRGERTNRCPDDVAQDVEPQRHFSTEIGLDRRFNGEVETDLMAKRMNPADSSDGFGRERVVVLAVHQNEVCRSNPL